MVHKTYIYILYTINLENKQYKVDRKYHIVRKFVKEKLI